LTRLFLDCDILLDVLIKRREHLKYSARVFEIGESVSDIQLITSPLVVANVHYIYCSSLSNRANKKSISLKNISKLLLYTEIVDLPGDLTKIILDNSDVKDFEDALQMCAAQKGGSSYLVTRNGKDFPAVTDVRILHPKEDALLIQALGYSGE